MLQCSFVDPMSPLLIVLLLAAIVILPAGGVALARIVGRRYGYRAALATGVLSFAAMFASVLTLHFATIDPADLGPLAVFVPVAGPVLDAQALTLERPRMPTELP